jgi:hypothetical protein
MDLVVLPGPGKAGMDILVIPDRKNVMPASFFGVFFVF